MFGSLLLKDLRFVGWSIVPNAWKPGASSDDGACSWAVSSTNAEESGVSWIKHTVWILKWMYILLGL